MHNIFNSSKGKKWLISHLKLGPMKITFTKKDGTERVMNCTLQDEVAVQEDKKTDRIRKENEEVLAVYDLDVKGWRSFRLDSIKQVYFTIE